MFTLTTISFLTMASAFSMLAADGGPLATRTSTQQAGGARIRVDVKLVMVPVSVYDGHGRSVTGLVRENFRIYDGERSVPIVSFGRQDQPITVGLIFDCSASMKDKFRNAREAPQYLFQQLNPEDESFLITVADKAALKQPLTSDFTRLQNILMFTRPLGSTALVDGVYLGLQQIRKSHNSRRALVVISDGGENSSRYTLHELLEMAMETDTQIFAVGLYDAPQTLEEAEGPGLMTQLCQRTGGVNFMVHHPDESQDALTKIGTALHNQYVLGYYQPDTVASGKYQKIRVMLALPPKLPRLSIRARAGYYLPER